MLPRTNPPLRRSTISKSAILSAAKELEQVPLPVDVQPCPPKDHGSTVRLRDLNPSLHFPKVDKLREILAGDYGRETDFVIFLDAPCLKPPPNARHSHDSAFARPQTGQFPSFAACRELGDPLTVLP